MNGRIVLVVFLTVVIVAGAIGIGMYAYNAGIAQGMATSGQVDAPPNNAAPFPYYRPYYFHPFGYGFGFLSCLIPLFIIFVFFGVMRMVFWRARWGGMHHRHWEGGVPPMAEEWHRKLHEQQEKKSNA
ncbi:MAG: hypothetical protein HZB51_15670 [Chloroflexi bacterium]|nr:hypothetical protein [Chloroflexota bacterium]